MIKENQLNRLIKNLPTLTKVRREKPKDCLIKLQMKKIVNEKPSNLIGN